MITMTYFHPWALCSAAADYYVPCAGNLRPSRAGWEDVMLNWLDGHNMSHESARYVGRFLSVFRVRPRHAEEDARSDEEVSGDELILTCAELALALKKQ